MHKLVLVASVALFFATSASADGIEPCVSCKDPRSVTKKTTKRPIKPKVVYVARVREVPVYRDRVVEKTVEVPVERPVYIDRFVDRPVYIEKRVEVPIERRVEVPVYIDRTRTVIVERPVIERVERHYGQPRVVDDTTSTGHQSDISGHRYQETCGCQPIENSRYSYSTYGSRNLNSDISGHQSDIRDYRDINGAGGWRARNGGN